MNPTETADILRQFNDHRRGCDVPSPKPSQIGRAIDAAVEMLERITSIPTHITSEQAPNELKKYWPIAASSYAKGWNDCIKDVLEKSK